MNMEAQINIEVRSRILEYSLCIEGLINDLLLMNLGIYGDKEKTKLFSNKGKLTFQNKIDLLFDIAILTNEEKLEFELLMNIRNKFLHVLDCSSFQSLFQQLESGIVNRFKKFLKEGQSISDEGACMSACYRLFQKNIDTIKKKIDVNISLNKKKHKFFQLQNEQIIYYVDFVHDFLEKVSIATVNSELENPKVLDLVLELQNILEEVVNKLNSKNHQIAYDEFFSSDENVKLILGIKSGLNDFPKWSDFKIKK